MQIRDRARFDRKFRSWILVICESIYYEAAVSADALGDVTERARRIERYSKHVESGSLSLSGRKCIQRKGFVLYILRSYKRYVSNLLIGV